MAKTSPPNFDTFNFVSPLMLTAYLCIGFIPNWEAVDKIAPQWLIMSGLNFLSLIYFTYKRKMLSLAFTLNLKSRLSITYIGFILWAIGSLLYAINPTEVLVNLSRQVNVLLMFLAMAVFLFSLKNKMRLLPWVITLILGVEIYAVLNEALEMINTTGAINSGVLKGVTANRNITAFSLAIKIPFVLFLIHYEKKRVLKLILSLLVGLVLLGLSMIQSRASFLAVGLTCLLYTVLHTYLFLRKNKKWNQLFQIGYLIVPLLLVIVINQQFLSNKGADALSRAATISVSTNDGSVNQRLRYYEDVLTHMSSNPIFGVGLGNWKLKSIDYDSKDIKGYIVPYHAHSDFIQLGAELGILGFLLYLGIFLWAVYYVYVLLRYSELDLNEKVFIFLLLVALGVYSVDANLNFPIARPQVLVVWSLIIGLITVYHQQYTNQTKKLSPHNLVNSIYLFVGLLLVIPSIYISNKIYDSLKGQMYLLQDFNSNKYTLPLNRVDNIVPDIPNITVTTIPINSVKARYYVNAKKYDKALALIEKGTTANPYLFFSELLKSQIYLAQGKLDSAKVYGRKAFFGLPNNSLHATHYMNLINQTKDVQALEESYELMTFKNDVNNWKNYLIVGNLLMPPRDSLLSARAQKAVETFPGDVEILKLANVIKVGQQNINDATAFSNLGLQYFNDGDYKNAAQQFNLALNRNPYEYSYFENAAASNYIIGNFDLAISQIDHVINEMNPNNGKCEYIKALIFIRMGDPIGACPYIEISVQKGYSQAQATFTQYCSTN
jgi:O-antigen ligase/tetratricopeptide (TPR) repeat protein